MSIGDLLAVAAWAIPAALLAGLLARGLWEPSRPVTTSTLLGEGGRSLRVLLFSDLHAGLNRVREKHLLQAISDNGADVLLFAGDACNGRRDSAKARLLLARLGEAARIAGIPALAVRGNHDRAMQDEDYVRAGFDLLVNRAVAVAASDGVRWRVAGLDDMKHGMPAVPSAESLPPGVPSSRTVILSHNPDAVYLVPEGYARYILAGHFHGGQIWMPFHFEFRVLRRERLAAEKVYGGVFERNGIAGYISRGIGCVVIPIRLFSRPEIAVLTLFGEDSPE